MKPDSAVEATFLRRILRDLTQIVGDISMSFNLRNVVVVVVVMVVVLGSGSVGGV